MLNVRRGTRLLPAEHEFIEEKGMQSEHLDESHLEGTVHTLIRSLQFSSLPALAPTTVHKTL